MTQINNMYQFSRELENLLQIKDLYEKIQIREIAAELGMPIGMSVGENILKYIKILKDDRRKI